MHWLTEVWAEAGLLWASIKAYLQWMARGRKRGKKKKKRIWTYKFLDEKQHGKGSYLWSNEIL